MAFSGSFSPFENALGKSTNRYRTLSTMFRVPEAIIVELSLANDA